jgi:hypothetical protein
MYQSAGPKSKVARAAGIMRHQGADERGDWPVKLALEVVIAIVLHPLAVVLAWLSIARRRDLSPAQKLIWAVICLVWGIGPILYMLLGDGSLW